MFNTCFLYLSCKACSSFRCLFLQRYLHYLVHLHQNSSIIAIHLNEWHVKQHPHIPQCPFDLDIACPWDAADEYPTANNWGGGVSHISASCTLDDLGFVDCLCSYSNSVNINRLRRTHLHKSSLTQVTMTVLNTKNSCIVVVVVLKSMKPNISVT